MFTLCSFTTTLMKMREFVILWMLVSLSGASETCNQTIWFPTLQELFFATKENTRINLPFSFHSDCGLPSDFRITVAKQYGGILAVYCLVSHRSGICHTSNENCKCRNGEGEFALTITVTKGDNTTWVWYSNQNGTQKKAVIFNVAVTDVTAAQPNNVGQRAPDVSDKEDNQPEPARLSTTVLVFSVASILAVAAMIIGIIVVRAKYREMQEAALQQAKTTEET